ncbi:MAG TPA: hypothetical protein V6D19_01375 [Stenomitos sp.]
MNRRDVERDVDYQTGYTDGSSSRDANNTGLGVLIGLFLVGLAGLGTWLFLGRPDTKPADTNIINLPSSAPSSAPAPSAPNVNVTVPAPKITVPAPKVEVPAAPSAPSAPSASDNSSSSAPSGGSNSAPSTSNDSANQ